MFVFWVRFFYFLLIAVVLLQLLLWWCWCWWSIKIIGSDFCEVTSQKRWQYNAFCVALYESVCVWVCNGMYDSMIEHVHRSGWFESTKNHGDMTHASMRQGAFNSLISDLHASNLERRARSSITRDSRAPCQCCFHHSQLSLFFAGLL